MKPFSFRLGALAGALAMVTVGGFQPVESQEDGAPFIRFTIPQSTGLIEWKTGQNGGRIFVEGESRGHQEHKLFLYTNPMHPDASGWYSGTISEHRRNGRWKGVIQLGSEEYPPNHGDEISIAIVALDKEGAKKAEEEAAKLPPGAPREKLPSLPQLSEDSYAIVEHVRVVIFAQ